MNLTVGPLDPAVYWRRRVLVLGGLLVAVALAVSTCSGSGSSGATSRAPGAGHSTTPATPPTLLAPVVGGTPGAGTAAPTDTTSKPDPTVSPTPSPNNAPPAAPLVACADSQMGVTVAVEALKTGYYLALTIRNISTTACSRDVGAAAQEIFVTVGSTKIWTSDCLNGSPAQDVRNFNPGIYATFRIYWDGHQYGGCTMQGPHPTGATAHGRLAALVSPPVAIPA